MSKAKYQDYFDQMIEENSELFEKFEAIHEQYKLNKQVNQDKFNDIGKEVREVIREWERKLCGAMERTRYSKYSQKVSEKFWKLIRDKFDQIDMVGVKIEQVEVE